MTTTDTLLVTIGGQMAGAVTRRQRALTFSYDDTYRVVPSATPLSVSMPMTAKDYPNAVIEPWLWGLLPDNDDVLRRWGREFEVSATSVFELLATRVGEDCAGAVQFATPERADAVFARPGQITWLRRRQVAERLRSLKRDGTTWLGPDFTGQFSLAGAQPKTALHHRGRRWGVPSGALPTTHILKPAIADFDDHDLNEHLCLDAAGRCGLVVARSHVERFEDQSAIVVERYDRRWVDDELIRVHQEDLCQALGRHPRERYEADGGPGAAEIVALLRGVMPASQATGDVWAFVDALIWNWIIAGPDAHAKNYSLLLAGDRVRLAPLYDLASVLPYDGVDERKIKLAMKLGGEYRLKAHQANTWLKVAAELGLEVDDVVARARQLVDAAPDAFATAASEDAIIETGSDLPARLVEAIAARAKRCHRLLP